MSKAKKSPAATTSALMYTRMIQNSEKSADAKWFGVLDEEGFIVCLTGKPELPTFEDLVTGWLAFPITHVEGRDPETGVPIWREQWLTREEAEAQVRKAHPYLKPAGTPHEENAA